MGHLNKYIFPAVDSQAVCAVQTLGAAAALKLNGTLSNSIQSKVSFVAQRYCRKITVFSPDNISAVVFTVVGTQNGVRITETITGVNNTTVESTLIYDEILSITSGAAATNVRVGSGYDGFFVLVNPNNNAGILPHATSLANPDATIVTTVYGTLDNILNNGQTFLTMIASATLYNLFAVKATGAEAMTVLSTAGETVTSYLVYINGSAATAAQTITFIFIQTLAK